MSVATLLETLEANHIKISLVNGQLKLKVPESIDARPFLPDIKASKAALIDHFLAQQKEAVETGNEIQAIEEQYHYPVSYAQRRLLISEETAELGNLYNIPTVRGFDYPLEVATLEKAYRELVNRHESLRTYFSWQEGNYRQKIRGLNDPAFQLEVEQFDSDEEVEGLINFYKTHLQHKFILTKGPLIKVSLAQSPSKSVLIINLHHILGDAWSSEVLLREITSHYQSYSTSGKPATLEPLSIHYKEYAIWQQKQLNHQNGKFRNFWTEQLKGELPITEFPATFERPARKSFEGSTYDINLSETETKTIVDFCRANRVSTFVWSQALLKALLYKYTDQTDLLIGAPVAGRSQSQLQNQIGFYVNLIPFRTTLNPDWTFEELAIQIRNNTLEVFEHQDIPLDRIVELSGAKRDMSRSPLFDIVLNVAEGQAGKGNENEFDMGTAKFDMIFFVTNYGNQSMKLSLNFRSDLYDSDFANQVLHHFKALALSTASRPKTQLKTLDILQAEDYQLLHQYNATEREFEGPATLLEAWKSSLDRHAAKEISWGDRRITYKDMARHAEQLAAAMVQDFNLVQGDVVAIRLPRSLEYLQAMLSCVYSGITFLPMDIANPEERIRAILQDSGAKLLIGLTEDLKEELTIPVVNIVAFNTNPREVAAPTQNEPSHSNSAYIIYTSGSTGVPKGVEVGQASLLNLCHWHIRQFAVSSTSRATVLASIGFDASVWEIWPYLLAGASLEILTDEQRADLKFIAQFYPEKGITHSFIPTALCEELKQLENNDYLSQVCFLTGGDRLKQYPLGWNLYNNYGPTENTVVTSFQALKDWKGGYIPIGKPIDNVKAFIVNSQGQLMPRGAWGELCIAGEGLAKSYWKDHEKTAVSFRSSTLTGNQKLYHSGDIARWTGDGLLQIKGRMDRQVKIRGFRIDIGEIEAALLAILGIKQATVLAKEDNKGSRLIAYYTADAPLEQKSIREELQQRIPSYMIPTAYQYLSHFPLKANGKLDTSALPEPDLALSQRVSEPLFGTEKVIHDLWCEVLDLDAIPKEDNFFELGGHSLHAARLSPMLEKEFGVQVTMRNLFDAPTISALGEAIDQLISEKDSTQVNRMVI